MTAPLPRGTSQYESSKKVFRLPDHLTRRVFPFHLGGAVTLVRLSSPVTAAGPRRICTVFPVMASLGLSVLINV
jgi:hypothetical protein